jgi:UDP-N-acetylmuramyl pentapeptide synthase
MTTLADIWPSIAVDYASLNITGLSANSRQVKQGDVFIALQGQHHDARQFIAPAIASGAVAVVVSRRRSILCRAICPYYLYC